MELNQAKETLEILLVEDNPGDVYIIKDHIKNSRINGTVTHCSSVNDALTLLSQKNFDAILLDLGLPDCFGLETLEKLKISKIKSPIIVLTGLDDEEIALKAVKENAELVGIGLANLITIFAPEIIVIGGGMAEAADSYLKEIRKSAFANSLENCRSEVRIERALLGSKAALTGAAYYSLSRLEGKSVW